MTAVGVLISIGVLLALLIRGRIPPPVLFAGWAVGYFVFGLVDEPVLLASLSNPALATLIVLLLVSIALERVPLLRLLSSVVITDNAPRAVARLSIFATTLSAFLNNTAVVGALLSTVTQQKKVAASKLLIPLSYASILGGIITLVGTSTNMVVSSLAVSAGLPALSMFQFTWVGLPTAILCVLVLVLTSRWLPVNSNGEQHLGQRYFLEAGIQPNSPLVNKTIQENRLRNLDGLFLLEIIRGEHLLSPVRPDEVLMAGDVLVFAGKTDKMATLHQFKGLQVFGSSTDELLRSNFVEVVIAAGSRLVNNTLRSVDFRTMFDAGVVGIRRGERRLDGQLGKIPLRAGDCLLLAVGSDFTQRHNLARNFHVLTSTVTRPMLTMRQSLGVLGGFACAIVLSAFGAVPLLKSLLALLLLMVICRVVTTAELGRQFPFGLAIIIAAALTIANVMQSTGASDIIANGVQWAFNGNGPMGALIGTFFATWLITELVTNNAAAALAFPIAISTANALGVSPTPFVMIVAYGASCSFLSPYGYQTHLMVYSAGRYRFTDFMKAGLPVGVVYMLSVVLLVPIFFPF